MTDYSNNINFRMLSTKLLEQYKSNSYLVLSELMKFENKMSNTSKNIVLLNLDCMFKWLTYIEKVFFRLSNNLHYNEIVTPLSIYLDQTLLTIEDSILINHELFNINITAPWLDVFKFNISVLNSYLTTDNDKYIADPMICYNEISSFVNLFIFHNLCILNEIENCNSSNSLFLIYDNFNIHFIAPKMNIHTEYLSFRYLTYQKYFKTIDYSDILIINKSSETINFDKLYNYDQILSNVKPIESVLRFK